MSDLPNPERQRVFEGMRFCVDVVAVATESGKMIRRDLVVHPGAVVVLPILDDGRIVMIRNYRFAVGRVLWELPAGTMELHDLGVGNDTVILTGFSASNVSGAPPSLAITDPTTGGMYLVVDVENVVFQ